MLSLFKIGREGGGEGGYSKGGVLRVTYEEGFVQEVCFPIPVHVNFVGSWSEYVHLFRGMLSAGMFLMPLIHYIMLLDKNHHIASITASL